MSMTKFDSLLEFGCWPSPGLGCFLAGTRGSSASSVGVAVSFPSVWVFFFFNFINFIFKIFLKFIYLFLFSYNCLHFLPIPPPHPPSPTSCPHLYPPPWFCPCVLYSSSYRPLSPLSLPHSPLAIVTMFLISMSLVIFCLLFSSVDYVPVKGEVIFVPPAWLISLSIMLSSSIHAVAKGISSFFLSAV